MKKNLFLELTLLFLISTILFSCVSSKKNRDTIPFTYDKEALKEGQISMFVPINLEGIDKTFKMQFDLGLNVSVIYENTLSTILEKYPDLNEHIGKRGNYNFLSYPYRLGDYPSSLDTLYVYKNFGSDANFNELSTIGTIGVNEVENKILIINFKNKTLKIREHLKSFQKGNFSFIDMRLDNNKIILNLKVGNKVEAFLFDTGNGVGIVTTDPNFYRRTTDNAKALRDTIRANSWGRTLKLPGAKIQDSIFIGNKSIYLEKERVYLTNDKKTTKLLSKYGVEHIIGPRYFLNEILVLDFIHNKFGIKK